MGRIIYTSQKTPKLYDDPGKALEDAVAYAGDGVKLFLAHGIRLDPESGTSRRGYVLAVETEDGQKLGYLSKVLETEDQEPEAP